MQPIYCNKINLLPYISVCRCREGLILHFVEDGIRLLLGGEIATEGGRSVGSVSSQEGVHRSGEKNNEWLSHVLMSTGND